MRLRRRAEELTDDELAEAVAEHERREEARKQAEFEHLADAILADLRREAERIAALPDGKPFPSCVGTAWPHRDRFSGDYDGRLRIDDLIGTPPDVGVHVIVLTIPEGTWHRLMHGNSNRPVAPHGLSVEPGDQEG